jgi:hypothetical protein
MWNDRRSLLLSRICTALCGAALAAVLVAAPWLARWLIRFSAGARAEHYGLFLATLYAGGALSAVLLLRLYRLLHNIAAGQVFVAANVRLLRGISWLCLACGAVAAVSAPYYLPWGIVGLAAGFVGLIIRVVKNVFAQAVALKEENDYTI